MIQIDDEDGKGVKFKGYCIDLIEEIRKLIGFEYEIYIAPDNNFGKFKNLVIIYETSYLVTRENCISLLT